jgi:hypothetical protein
MVLYTDSIPWEDWMQQVSIAVSSRENSCCSAVQKLPVGEPIENLLTCWNKIPHYELQPLHYVLSELEKYDIANPFLHSMEDYDQRYDILKHYRSEGTAKIVFKVASDVIDLSLGDNQTVMDRMVDAFRLIENDSLAVGRKIVIAAAASPEGTLSFNTELAQKRVEAMCNYFCKNMHLSHDMFELINLREDWDGLRTAVVASDLLEKEEILSIINAYTIEQEIRKTKLKQLNNGKPYKWMLENLYPSLRNGGYLQIYYEVKRDQSLFWTDEWGRQVWVDPDSPRNRFVTAYNKSLALLNDHQYGETIDLLLPYQNDARSWNLLGVAYMMMNKDERAANFFMKAAESGDENARSNLDEVKCYAKVGAVTE